MGDTTVRPQRWVQLKVANGPGNPRDWVGLYTADGPDLYEIRLKYLNNKTVPPGSGLTSATLKFAAPRTPGRYNFRFFRNGTYDRLAVSQVVTVK